MNERARMLSVARWIVSGILVAYLAAYAALSDPLSAQAAGIDMAAYWQAAERLQAGAPLFPMVPDEQAADVYRYSAWFAYAWIPMTQLPNDVVQTAWIAVLLACSGYVLWPLVHRPTFASVCLAALMAPILFETSWMGNAQTLVVAALAASMGNRWGPVTIGAAASLKVVPIAFSLVFIARRQWWRLAFALTVFLALSAPTLLFDLSHYPLESTSILTGVSPWVWYVLGGLVALGALIVAWQRPRFAGVAAGILAIVAVSRIHISSADYLLVDRSRLGDAG